MINVIIRWSIYNRILVLLLTAVLLIAGSLSLVKTPIDAIPDLSDVQVIVKTHYAGQAPQVVEDQVTYPLTTALLSVPGAHTVRGFSFFGDSYIYVIFDEDTDVYWARSRVLEYLNQASAQLPAGVNPELGPDASGVGWVYIYALQNTVSAEEDPQYDLSQLRSLQDWFLKFELQTVEGVSEVATLGGMVKQYQVVIDPEKLKAFKIPLQHVQAAVQQSSAETGASVIEMAEAEYMVRVTGYITSAEQLKNIPLGTAEQGSIIENSRPLLLSDIADIEVGPQMRRGIAELNGMGEVVGGIVVMRYEENAAATIRAVKQKLSQLKSGLPDGVEVVPVYDRSTLIDNAVENLWQKVAEELLLVAIVCFIFLLHARSALVAILSLPAGILIGFILIQLQGLNANIMSLGGIAIAIGAMIDGAIVMIENYHKHLEETPPSTEKQRWQLVAESAAEVGPSLFFSLMIITVSFLPVFTLQAQEGKLFAPLAFTKTYSMAVAALLAITLVPILMGYLIKGNIIAETKNPLNRVMLAGYKKLLSLVLRFPKTTLISAGIVFLLSLYPAQKIGSEFMPDLNEGDLMYMPTAYPGLSIGKARQILQQTDKMIAAIPEVKSVFGKIGRAETATDPAPLTMIETFIQFKPQSEWRPGIDYSALRSLLNEAVQVPGLTNAWVMPIKTRIDMLATGIKTPLGLKIAGPDVNVIQTIGEDIEAALAKLPTTASVYAERTAAGRFIDISVNRYQAAQYGFHIETLQNYLSMAIGGKNIQQSVEGLERYPINLRFPQVYRDSPEALADLPLLAPNGNWLRLADVADINISAGPAMLKSENARLNGWLFIDVSDSDITGYVQQAQNIIDEDIHLPAGYSIRWAGQYEYLQRAKDKLSIIVPLTLLIISLLLFWNFKDIRDVALILSVLPFSLIGSILLLRSLEYNYSIAVGVGFIALAGVAAETGVIMLHNLKRILVETVDSNSQDAASIQALVILGASRRLRPVMMTAIATIVGLIPVMIGSGTGSEVMSRIAAPMVGGMISAVLMTLFILPAAFLLMNQRSKTSNKN